MREDLVPVDVAGQDSGELPREVLPADYVWSVAEREVRRAHGRPFDTLMEAEESDVGGLRIPLRRGQDLVKPRTNATLERESAQVHESSPNLQRESPWSIEQVDAGVGGEPGVGDSGSLVVARHHEDRDAGVRDSLQRLECLVHERCGNARVVKHVAAVHHEVDAPGQSRSEGSLVVREEVMPAPATLDPGLYGQIEAQMGVG